MSRWVVHARAEFDATHALTSYGGRPEASHQHRWAVAIRVATSGLTSEGYAVDFHALHDLLSSITRPLDGSNLNTHPEIGTPSPTAERVAEVLASRLDEAVAGLGASLVAITVWEGPDNRVDLEL